MTGMECKGIPLSRKPVQQNTKRTLASYQKYIPINVGLGNVFGILTQKLIKY